MTNGLIALRPIAPKPVEFDLQKFSLDSNLFRNEKDLTRKQLASLLNDSEHNIVSYENKGIEPRVELFFNLCRLMDKKPEEYFK